MASKNCSKCGITFTCNANSNGCWCEQYQLSVEALKDLKNSYIDCLCQECLKGYQVDNNQTSSDNPSNYN